MNPENGSFQSENDTGYIFDTHPPILTVFSTQQGHIIKYSMQISVISRLAIFV